MAYVPMFDQKDLKDNKNVEQCAICLEPLLPTQRIHTGTCFHRHHMVCIRATFTVAKTRPCPLCRAIQPPLPDDRDVLPEDATNYDMNIEWIRDLLHACSNERFTIDQFGEAKCTVTGKEMKEVNALPSTVATFNLLIEKLRKDMVALSNLATLIAQARYRARLISLGIKTT